MCRIPSSLYSSKSKYTNFVRSCHHKGHKVLKNTRNPIDSEKLKNTNLNEKVANHIDYEKLKRSLKKSSKSKNTFKKQNNTTIVNSSKEQTIDDCRVVRCLNILKRR